MIIIVQKRAEMLLSKAKIVQGICESEQQQQQLLQQQQQQQQQQEEGDDLEMGERRIFVDGCEKCLQEMWKRKNDETQSQNQFRPIFTAIQQQRHNNMTTTTTTSERGGKRQERQFHSI